MTYRINNIDHEKLYLVEGDEQPYISPMGN